MLRYRLEWLVHCSPRNKKTALRRFSWDAPDLPSRTLITPASLPQENVANQYRLPMLLLHASRYLNPAQKESWLWNQLTCCSLTLRSSFAATYTSPLLTANLRDAHFLSCIFGFVKSLVGIDRAQSISFDAWNQTTEPTNSTVWLSASLITMSSKPSSQLSGDSTITLAPLYSFLMT